MTNPEAEKIPLEEFCFAGSQCDSGACGPCCRWWHR